MTGYEQFIAIVLASFLAIFLLLGIILLVVAIKVVLAVKRLTKKAEMLTDKAEHLTDFLKNAAGPMALARSLSFVADTLFNKRNVKAKRKG